MVLAVRADEQVQAVEEAPQGAPQDPEGEEEGAQADPEAIGRPSQDPGRGRLAVMWRPARGGLP